MQLWTLKPITNDSILRFLGAQGLAEYDTEALVDRIMAELPKWTSAVAGVEDEWRTMLRECIEADVPSYTNLAQLRTLADGGLISTEHPEFAALRAAGFVTRGIPTETAPWLDKWYVISDAGIAALAHYRSPADETPA
jgi:hypothetical protein